MSNTPFDPGTSLPTEAPPVTDELASVGATGSPARRRRHRAAGPRAAAPADVAGQRASEDEPSVPTAAATAEPAAPQPESEPASIHGRATGRPRGGRRGGRARAPQLVAPERNETAPQEIAAAPAAPAASVEPATGAPAMIPVVPVLAGVSPLATPGASIPPAGPVAPAAEASSELAHAPDGETPTPGKNELRTPVRRYRFDRPAPRAAAPSLRPERLNPASLQPESPAAPIGGESVATARQAEPTAPLGPLDTPPVDTSALAPVAEPLAAVTATIDQLLTTPVTLDETPTPLYTEETDGEELDSGTASQADGAEGSITRRRRRRRRSNGGNGGAVRHLETIVPTDQSEPEPVSLAGRLDGGRAGEPLAPHEEPAVGSNNAARVPTERQSASPYGGPTQPYQMYAPYQQEPWDVSNPYEQLGQPQSPFGAPEPSPSRGFGPQTRGVAGPAPERLGRSSRGGERATEGISVSQLGATLTQAIQQQTDRLLTELRHTQAPPSMTVMFPPFPSTERVGVFVDVANLLYSSRSLRIGLDFGRLLEFLRGNRRLVRAHAYAPTNPEPHAEQQFLSVVKGVGYRITTKNYKTFSSGAKKADLDLDMCMDIVRLVDAEALDTVVLVSGDSDFLPLLEYCSDHGVRVEVAAFDDSAAMILRQSCDLFINLSLVEDIRA